MFRKQVRHLLPGIALCGIWLVLVMGALPAYGATKLFSSSPRLAHVDIEKNLLVITTKTGVYAQRLDTGKRVWSHSVQGNTGNFYPAVGNNSFLIETIQGFQVFDISTGKKRWRYENKDNDIKPLPDTRYIGTSDWIVVLFVSSEEQGIVFAPDGRTLEPTLDGRKINIAIVAGWMPDGKTLLIGENVKTVDEVNIISLYFWEPESGTVEKGYDIKSADNLNVHCISRLGKAVIDEINVATYKHKMTLIDAYTGAIERGPDESERGCQFTEDGYMLVRGDDQKSVKVTNLATDGKNFTLSKEGHFFFWYAPVTAYGKSWVYSRDEEQRYWLWSLAEDLMPRMIWQTPSGTYLPGEVIAIKLPYILFQTGSQMKAYRLEDLVCEKTWGAKSASDRRFKTCANFHRAVAYTWKDEEETGQRSTIAQIFEPDNPVPILETAGYASAISPDGRYCLVQNKDNWGPVHLIEVDSGNTLATIEEEKMGSVETAFSPDSRYCLVQYPQARKTHLLEASSGKTCVVIEREKEPEDEERNARRNSDDILFSPDSRYAIVYAAKQLTFISLNPEYTQRDVETPEEIKRYAFFSGLAFSSDGKYYVFCEWMHGRVPLYATDTGEVVHTFKEPEKVVSRWESQPEGFLETAEHFGKKLAGWVVTLDSQPPSITSRFSKDGKQLITMAEGEILRVWDINSGKIVRTIRTNLPQERDDYGQINNEIILSANGAYAFAYNQDGFGTASLWEVATGKEITKDYLSPGRILYVSVADDGSGVYMTINDELYSVAGKKK